MILTADEIRLIFELIREKYGPGTIMEPLAVGQLQAKLSIMLEVKTKAAR